MGVERPLSRLRGLAFAADPGAVAHARPQPQAGRYAEARYRALVRSEWRPRVLRIALRITAAGVAIAAAYWILFPRQGLFFATLMAGMLIGAFAVLPELAPWWIKKWREGAEAERETERLIGPLAAEGWHAVHDVDIGHGNLDHVLVGPGGVYLLETKSRPGKVRFERGRLVTRRADEPVEESRDEWTADRARARAAALRHALDYVGVRWVNAVIVVHGELEPGAVEGESVTVVRSDRLADWLRAQPVRLPPYRVKEIAAAVADLGPEDFD